ncbi:signal peptidase I [Candidatus Kaiserbacteria bacterium]|nr:signal peptidase I [Candidatus Kaiserbacteria bacterium]
MVVQCTHMIPTRDDHLDALRDSRDDVASLPVQAVAPTPSSDRSLIGYTVIALLIALFIRFFVAAPYVVSGSSMEPTFDDWDYFIIDRVTYRVNEPQRGDVIVFDLPQDTTRALIKRVIGLPGETIEISGATVTVTNAAHPEGIVLNEPYLDPANLGGVSELRVVIPEDSYFVLGDNRRVSADSRIWGFLPRHDIVGRVLLRLYPPRALSVLPGVERYTIDSTTREGSPITR